ncbi:hypothetical protein Fot_08468 [Forsythia ovata]|uniref:Late embryogenesis abundant protein n=1 Tax=Forsythia ovata TaxID=205694 RepID=A0ABD1WYQ6_9LAMI
MAATATSRGAQTMNSMYFKPMLRKAYHRKSSDIVSDTIKLNRDEKKNKNMVAGNCDATCWIPDDRTGIYYPKGQEKIMEDVPRDAGRNFGAINWFSNHEDCI